MLEIIYDEKTRVVRLTMGGDESAWADICSACEESTEVAVNVGHGFAELPWYGFLQSKRAISAACRIHGVEIILSPSLEQVLRQAAQSQTSYSFSKNAEPVSERELLTTLSASGFVRTLTPEQMRNVRRMSRLSAAATFSVPGAGKTTEALAFFLCRSLDESQLLIVAPKNAFAAWEEQLDECLGSDSIEVTRLTGGVDRVRRLLRDTPRVALMTYHMLDRVYRAGDCLPRHLVSKPTFMFLDESHHMKRGWRGKIGSSVLSLAHLPVGKLIMSGTPMPNSAADLVPQFDFLYPEIECDPESVIDLITTIFVRTTKDELGLPPVKRTLVPVEMGASQRRLYDLMRSEAARQAEGALGALDRIRLRRLGKSVIRLIQTASNPALLVNSGCAPDDLLTSAVQDGDSPKLQYACQRARRLAKEGRKTIIWSSFVANVETIALRLRDIGADYIHGGVEAGDEEETNTREAKIRRFHDDPFAFVLVANPAACAEGISLHTVCHNAIYVDRNFNAAQYLQSQDRIHRLGLPAGTETFVEILCSSDTVDESVNRRLSDKIGRMAAVLEDPHLCPEPVPLDLDDDLPSKEDLEDLLAHLRSD